MPGGVGANRYAHGAAQAAMRKIKGLYGSPANEMSQSSGLLVLEWLSRVWTHENMPMLCLNQQF